MICSFSEIEDEGSFGNLVLRSEVRVSILCCLVGYLCEAGLVKRKYLAPKKRRQGDQKSCPEYHCII